MSPEQWAKIEEKRARNAYFAGLEQAARVAGQPGQPRPSVPRAPRAKRSSRVSANCQGPCGRPMRLGGVKAAQAPGTVRHDAYNKCSTCLRAERQGLQKKHMPLGTKCAGCDRPLRRHGTKLADHPGTLIQSGRKGEGWLCVTCKKHERGVAKPQRKAASTCVRCKRPMKSGKGPLPDGWVRHNAHDYCTGCMSWVERQKAKERCLRCQRPMVVVARGVSVPEGTVRHESNGRCKSCAGTVGKNQRRAKA